MNKKIVILGSTVRSVGRPRRSRLTSARSARARRVARHKDDGNAGAPLKPRFVTMSDERAAAELKIQLADTDIDVRCGRESLLEAASLPDADIIFNSIGQSAGLEPTLSALSAGKRLALANKESIVIAGELVTRAAKESGGEIIPVDSEHSAIYQCRGRAES